MSEISFILLASLHSETIHPVLNHYVHQTISVLLSDIFTTRNMIKSVVPVYAIPYPTNGNPRFSDYETNNGVFHGKNKTPGTANFAAIT